MPPHHRAYEHVPQKAEAPVRTFLRLLGLLRGQGRRLALLLPGQVATTAAGLVWPWVLGRATDLVASGPVAWGRLSLLLLGGLAATGTGCLAQVFNGRTASCGCAGASSPRCCACPSPATTRRGTASS